jgi:hypothetical protein
LIGTNVPVQLDGKGFGTNPTVNAGSGIAVTVNSATDTRIVATFAIATNAPAGNHNVTVTAASQTSTSVNFYVQAPTYFYSPSAAQTGMPSPCVNAGFTGYFINVSCYVADASGNRISKSGMAPGENLGDGVWHDDFATPTTTNTDGSFNDTPFGACYDTSAHFCDVGSPQSFRITNSGNVYSVSTNTTSRKCTDGIELVIQGNPAPQNKTYTFGNVQ